MSSLPFPYVDQLEQVGFETSPWERIFLGGTLEKGVDGGRDETEPVDKEKKRLVER